MQILSQSRQSDFRFLFAATTGRSGTNQLAHCLEACDGVLATHEDPPVLNGRWLRLGLQTPIPHSWLIGRFARQLARSLRDSGRSIRADISHVFVKWYAPTLLDALGAEHCCVVHLWRDPRAVIASFLRLGAIPGQPWGTHWMGDPRWRRVRLRLDPRDEYEAVAWHVLESWLRGRDLRRSHPAARHVDLSFDVLCDPAAFRHWLAQIGLVAGSGFEQCATQVQNAKSHRKQAENRRVDEARIEAAWNEVQQLAQERSLLSPEEAQRLLSTTPV